MTDPIDFKKAKQSFEPAKSKSKLSDEPSVDFNSDEIYDILSKNSNEVVSAFFKLQQTWCNNAYNTFKDYDTYLIQVYLILQVFKKYTNRFQYLSLNEFYDKTELAIEKINLIEISKELNIPKETIRRKVNFLQDKNIIYRKGKTIFLIIVI